MEGIECGADTALVDDNNLSISVSADDVIASSNTSSLAPVDESSPEPLSNDDSQDQQKVFFTFQLSQTKKEKTSDKQPAEHIEIMIDLERKKLNILEKLLDVETRRLKVEDEQFAFMQNQSVLQNIIISNDIPCPAV
ncbi:uncharacterized protein LOC121373579 isoform X3 [Gigantopelta aegis]|uniref:uncharacterized protein LOC121373579 isoform X3 n=1 Tax=Gigantopelta aegis TaxID=1735272 RepID=UPI001B887D2F|nr:uncharacterized protein LOC121373579 isoform X3 [Gigantopelta aegis]